MELDIRQVAEKLIRELLVESDRLRERAEGVRLYLHSIITENEKLHHGKQHSDTDGTTSEEEQTK